MSEKNDLIDDSKYNNALEKLSKRMMTMEEKMEQIGLLNSELGPFFMLLFPCQEPEKRKTEII